MLAGENTRLASPAPAGEGHLEAAAQPADRRRRRPVLRGASDRRAQRSATERASAVAATAAPRAAVVSGVRGIG